MKKTRQRLCSIVVCLFFVFTVLLYGPFSLYLPNAGDFWFTPGTVAKVVLPVSAVVFLVLVLLFMLLPEKASRFCVKLLFGISLAMYLQGNFMNIRYGTGVLDGTGIRWQHYTKYGLGTSLVWILSIAFPFLAPEWIRRFTKLEFDAAMIQKVLAGLSAAFILMQVPAFAVQALSFQPQTNTDFSITRQGEFELGDQENVIIFVLDTLDEAYYQAFLKEDPDYTQNLTGFVHYGNTLASGARTTVGVPAMFTGIPFTRSETYNEYKEKVWGAENGLSVLADAGYDVRVYSENVLFSEDCTEYVKNFSTETAEVGSWKTLAEKLYCLDLYKFMPHYLKRFFLIDTADFDAAMKTGELYAIKDAAFWEGYRKNGVSKGEDLHKTARIYHLRGTHPKYVLSREGTYYRKATLEDTTAGCFYCVNEFLEDLKKKGLYDSSTIIITADHGDLNKAEQAIFMLKRKGADGPYTDNLSPVSLFDLPVFLADLAGTELEHLPYSMRLDELQEDTVRERHFFRHHGGNISSVIDEYMTTGSLYDPDQLEKIAVYEDQTTAEDYVLGTELSFGMEQSGNPYIVDGFGYNTGIRTVLYGPHSILKIPFAEVPESGEMHVHIEVTLAHKDLEKELVVYANDQEVYNGPIIETSLEDGINFDVPVSCMDDTKELTLNFTFPWVSEDEMKLKVSKRTDTIRFIALTID